MNAEPFDALVIGAGVAGAAFASQVTLTGRRVLLIERSAWPRSKVCGCCLNNAALQPLRRLGLGPTLTTTAAPLDRLTLRARSRTAQLTVSGGLALSRALLDDLLVQRAVSLGTDFRPGTTAALSRPDPSGGWSVRLRTATGEHTVTAPLVAAADGLAGTSLTSLQPFQPVVSPHAWFGVGGTLSGPVPGCGRGEVAMHIAARGYAGLVRLDDRTVNLAAALDPAWTKSVGGPARAVNAVITDAGGEPLHFHEADLRGTRPLTRRRSRVSAPGLLVLGDAAGYIEPFTGEGMAWALAGAEAAAGLVNAGLGGRALADAWADWHAVNVRARQRTCSVMRQLLRRPRLVGCIIAAINTLPAAARAAAALARRVERPYPGTAA